MRILILGGDKRYIKVAEYLREENLDVSFFGIDKKYLQGFEGDIYAESLDKALMWSNYILGPIPFSRDGIKLNTPLYSGEILINDVISGLEGGRTFTSFNIPQKNIEELSKKKIKLYDLSAEEELNVMSAIPTAEGAIQYAMENTPFTINGSVVLVLGYGRIGKILSKLLKGLGADVYVEARKAGDLAWIEAMGYKAIDIKKLDSFLYKFDIIFNTVPAMILTKDRIRSLKKDCLIVDVSTNPGGVDFKACKDRGIKAELVLGIPGKVAPHTAALYIKNALLSIMRR